MLSWICPDCGCDCAPTDQECPDCSDLVQAGMVALARAVQEQRDSFPPPPEIPLQDRVPVPAPAIEARTVPAEPPRTTEPEPAPMSAPAAILPMASGPADHQMLPPVPPPLIAAQPPPVKTQRRPMLPGWLISLLVATTLSLGGAAIVRNMDANRKAEAASPPGGQAAGGASDSPVEVTGLRIVGGPRFGPQLQYIVVSHTATPLSKLNLRILVRSTSLPSGSQPLLTFTASVNELAPFSSQEMSSDLDDTQSSGLPGWERLKAEVQVQ